MVDEYRNGCENKVKNRKKEQLNKHSTTSKINLKLSRKTAFFTRTGMVLPPVIEKISAMTNNNLPGKQNQEQQDLNLNTERENQQSSEQLQQTNLDNDNIEEDNDEDESLWESGSDGGAAADGGAA